MTDHVDKPDRSPATDEGAEQTTPPRQTTATSQPNQQPPAREPSPEPAHPSFLAGLRAASKRIKESIGPIGDLKGPFALVGVLIYGAFRLSYDAFYGQLGLTPEEVGINPTTVLLRAVFGTLFFVGLGAVVVPVVYLLLSFLFIRKKTPSSQQHGRLEDAEAIHRSMLRDLEWMGRIGGACMVLVGSAIAIRGWSNEVPDTVFGGLRLVILGSLFGLVPSAPPAPNRAESKTSAERIELRQAQRSLSRAAFVGILLFAWLLAAHTFGVARSHAVQSGASVSPNALTSVLGLRAEMVCVGWIGQNDRPNGLDTTPLMLLGQANATLVFYRDRINSEAPGPVRLPASKVAVLPISPNGCR
jgi:hypothetical protein